MIFEEEVTPRLWNEIVVGLEATSFLSHWLPFGMGGGLSHEKVGRYR